MPVLIQSIRLICRRSAQRQNSFPSSKRQKANIADTSTERSRSVSIKDQKHPTSSQPELPPQPFWERLGPLSEAFGAYARTQKRRPWATQVGTSLVVYLCGDLSAQKIDGDAYDPFRTMRHLTIGGICSIPAYTW